MTQRLVGDNRATAPLPGGLPAGNLDTLTTGVTELPEREDGSLGRHHVECALARPTKGRTAASRRPARYLLQGRRLRRVRAMGRARGWAPRGVPAYPNSSITELKFPSLNPSGLLQLVKPRFCSSVPLVSTWGFSEPTTLPCVS